MASSRLQALFALLVTYFVYLFQKARKSNPRNVKWVTDAYPVLGSTVHILRSLFGNRLLDLYVDWQKRFGMTYAYKISGAYTAIATVDPKNIEHFLKTNFDNYIKGYIFRDPFTILLGNGIFNVDGDLWLNQRKTASKLFSQKKFEGHIWDCILSNIAKVKGILDSDQGTTFDMFKLLNRFTLDTIGQVGFSVSVGSLEDPASPFLKSFDQAQRLLIRRFWTAPYWKAMKLFGLGWEPELQRHINLLDDYSNNVVQALKEKVKDKEDHSLVGLFLNDLSPAERESAETAVYLRDLVLNVLIAGRDTTAQCMAWTIFELTQHPRVVEKALNEIASICQDGPLKVEHLKDLKYVKAIWSEGLRLHPSVPYDGKLCLSDDVWPDGTFVPAGAVVQWIPYAQGRCQEIWGADADEYRPERWLEMKQPSTFAYSAFNAGPRECLGRKLAELELTTFLTSVLQEFDFTLMVPPETIKYDVQLTLGMHELPLVAGRREVSRERGAS